MTAVEPLQEQLAPVGEHAAAPPGAGLDQPHLLERLKGGAHLRFGATQPARQEDGLQLAAAGTTARQVGLHRTNRVAQ